MNEASEIATERFELTDRVAALEEIVNWLMWGAFAFLGLIAVERLLEEDHHDGD